MSTAAEVKRKEKQNQDERSVVPDLGAVRGRAVAVQLDVASAESVAAAAAWAAEHFPRVDALVNNAAVMYDT